MSNLKNRMIIYKALFYFMLFIWGGLIGTAVWCVFFDFTNCVEEEAVNGNTMGCPVVPQSVEEHHHIAYNVPLTGWIKEGKYVLLPAMYGLFRTP